MCMYVCMCVVVYVSDTDSSHHLFNRAEAGQGTGQLVEEASADRGDSPCLDV